MNGPVGGRGQENMKNKPTKRRTSFEQILKSNKKNDLIKRLYNTSHFKKYPQSRWNQFVQWAWVIL